MTPTPNIQDLGIIDTNSPLIIKLIDLSIPAGFPSPAQDFAEEDFDLNSLIKHPDATHMMRLSGESMQPTIMDGALLLVDCSIIPKHKDIVIAAVNGEHTCKRYYNRQNRIGLYGDNKEFPFIDFVEGDELRIFGVVVYHFYKH